MTLLIENKSLQIFKEILKKIFKNKAEPNQTHKKRLHMIHETQLQCSVIIILYEQYQYQEKVQESE